MAHRRVHTPNRRPRSALARRSQSRSKVRDVEKHRSNGSSQSPRTSPGSGWKPCSHPFCLVMCTLYSSTGERPHWSDSRVLLSWLKAIRRNVPKTCLTTFVERLHGRLHRLWRCPHHIYLLYPVPNTAPRIVYNVLEVIYVTEGTTWAWCLKSCCESLVY